MRQKGIDGEVNASNFLRSRGYKILSKNFHSRFGEIDIVAFKDNTLVFVEVKFRSSRSFGSPMESITNSKLEKMKKTAYYFINSNNLSKLPFRFDAIEIEKDKNGKHEINHVKNITL